MINIRPVSDLRNKYSEVEEQLTNGNPIYLTKNGYGSAVLLSLEEYAELTENIELLLDEADRQAAIDKTRFSHEEVFGKLRSLIQESN